MVMRKKPTSEADFLLQASTVKEQREPDKNKTKKTELRFPETLFSALDQHLEGLDIKPSRNQWILMAIKEKLDREKS
jgi:predicted HicB family RNase H-like nuclease